MVLGSVGARPTASFCGIHCARLECKFAFLCNWLPRYQALCRRVSGGGSVILLCYNVLGLTNTWGLWHAWWKTVSMCDCCVSLLCIRVLCYLTFAMVVSVGDGWHYYGLVSFPVFTDSMAMPRDL